MPPVPSYQDAYNQLASVYDPQVNSVNSQIAQLQPLQNAQQKGLDQAKINAFRDITNTANQRGMLFSGFSPDQQAQYVGTKYLPAVANLKQSFLNQRTTLLDKINAINAQRSQQATSTVAAAQAAAAQDAYRQAQLQLGYARLARSGSKVSAPTTGQIAAAITQGLSSVRGRDGYVSPQDYAQALGQWIGAGQKRTDFNKQFQNFRNPRNGYYNYAIKQAGL